MGRKRGEREKSTTPSTPSSPEHEREHGVEDGSMEANEEANGAMLQSIKVMMDDLRSDIFSNFESTVAKVVRKEVADALKPMETQLVAHGQTIMELERAANDQSDVIQQLQATVSSLTKLVDSLTEKCDDLESRSRLNNVRLIGLAEGLEGSRPIEFVSKLLKDLLGLDELPVLDRCHRSLRARPKDTEPPRPIIMRVNLFQTRNLILRRAAECSPIRYEGGRLSLFADFSKAVATKRAAFKTVKAELHLCPGVKFGLVFPAVLRITPPDGVTRRFEDPEKAMDFVVKKLKKGVAPEDVG